MPSGSARTNVAASDVDSTCASCEPVALSIRITYCESTGTATSPSRAAGPPARPDGSGWRQRTVPARASSATTAAPDATRPAVAPVCTTM